MTTPLDPGIAVALQQMAAAGVPHLSAVDVATARTIVAQGAISGEAANQLIRVAEVRSETIAGSIPVRVYSPSSATPVPTIVVFHGGGFVTGTLDSHDLVARRLSVDVGAVVVSVDYRLAPEHPFPAAVDDAEAAVRWVIAHLAEYGNDPSRVAVSGDSAGANLATVAAQLLAADGIQLAAQQLVYPTTDAVGEYASADAYADGYFLRRADMNWFAEHYLGVSADDPRALELAADPRFSPLRVASLAGQPPAVIATAEFDPLRDQGDAYAAALSAAGVHVEHRQFTGLIHGFLGMSAISAGAEAATVWLNSTLKQLLG